MRPPSTVRAGTTLILGHGQQLALLEVDEAGLPPEAYADLEQVGRFTGERLFFTNEKLYLAIVRLLSRGTTYREIAEICGVSINTVCGVAYREGISIETLRVRIGRLGLDVAQLTMECIRDLLADPDWRREASAKDLAIIHGIAFQNAQLALGGATARIETQDTTPPDHEAYLRLIRNVTPTGFGSGNPAPNSGAAAAPGGALIELPAADPEPPQNSTTDS